MAKTTHAAKIKNTEETPKEQLSHSKAQRDQQRNAALEPPIPGSPLEAPNPVRMEDNYEAQRREQHSEKLQERVRAQTVRMDDNYEAQARKEAEKAARRAISHNNDKGVPGPGATEAEA